MSRQQIVESVIEEIMKGVSTRIREIVREEIDIERKRVRKQLLEEFREKLSHPTQVAQNRPAPPKKKLSIDTGDRLINSILEEVQTDMVEMGPDMRFEPETSIDEVSHQMLSENRRTNNGGLWKPASKNEAYNFDPLKMDPSMIDWSNMVDALEDQNKLPGEK